MLVVDDFNGLVNSYQVLHFLYFFLLSLLHQPPTFFFQLSLSPDLGRVVRVRVRDNWIAIFIFRSWTTLLRPAAAVWLLRRTLITLHTLLSLVWVFTFQDVLLLFIELEQIKIFLLLEQALYELDALARHFHLPFAFLGNFFGFFFLELLSFFYFVELWVNL